MAVIDACLNVGVILVDSVALGIIFSLSASPPGISVPAGTSSRDYSTLNKFNQLTSDGHCRGVGL